MTSPRIYGRKLWFKVDDIEHAADIKECLLEHEDKADDLTFGEAAEGVTAAKLSITAIQSTDPASFWSWCWTNAGAEVPFRMAVHGNDVPTASEPHVTGTMTIGPRPAIGGKADPRTAYEFKVEWSGKTDAALVTTAP